MSDLPSRQKDEKVKNYRITSLLNLLRNIVTLVIVFPIIVFIFTIGTIVPEKQWSDFWDGFLDDVE